MQGLGRKLIWEEPHILRQNLCQIRFFANSDPLRGTSYSDTKFMSDPLFRPISDPLRGTSYSDTKFMSDPLFRPNSDPLRGTSFERKLLFWEETLLWGNSFSERKLFSEETPFLRGTSYERNLLFWEEHLLWGNSFSERNLFREEPHLRGNSFERKLICEEHPFLRGNSSELHMSELNLCKVVENFIWPWREEHPMRGTSFERNIIWEEPLKRFKSCFQTHVSTRLLLTKFSSQKRIFLSNEVPLKWGSSKMRFLSIFTCPSWT